MIFTKKFFKTLTRSSTVIGIVCAMLPFVAFAESKAEPIKVKEEVVTD